MATIQDEIDKKVNEEMERMMRVIIRSLQRIGERCVKKARSLPSLSRDDPAAKHPHQPNYIDDSGNLRSSIGYIIIVDGQIVTESSFEVVGNGREGSEMGKSFAESLVSNYMDGIALVVVAGMNYAEFVKKNKYDVLDSAELLAEQLVQKLNDDLQQEAQ